MKAAKFILATVLTAACMTAAAADEVGAVAELEGKAYAMDLDGTRRALEVDSPVFLGDQVSTGNGSKVYLRFKDGSFVSMGEKSAVTVTEFLFDKKNKKENRFGAFLDHGVYKVISGLIVDMNPDRFKVRTRYSVIGIRGCEVNIISDPETGDRIQAEKISVKGDIIVRTHAQEKAAEAAKVKAEAEAEAKAEAEAEAKAKAEAEAKAQAEAEAKAKAEAEAKAAEEAKDLAEKARAEAAAEAARQEALKQAAEKAAAEKAAAAAAARRMLAEQRAQAAEQTQKEAQQEIEQTQEERVYSLEVVLKEDGDAAQTPSEQSGVDKVGGEEQSEEIQEETDTKTRIQAAETTPEKVQEENDNAASELAEEEAEAADEGEGDAEGEGEGEGEGDAEGEGEGEGDTEGEGEGEGDTEGEGESIEDIIDDMETEPEEDDVTVS